MFKHKQLVTLLLTGLMSTLAVAADEKKRVKTVADKGEITATTPVLWREPADISQRDLFYGPGGKEHQPGDGPYTFVEEDREASNPKFEVKAPDGTKWKVKMGTEAKPETVATRFVWAAGYFVDWDYLVASLQVPDMPKLHRGNDDVSPGGMVHDVRLETRPKGYEKVSGWRWDDSPFNNTREFNGLRVLMAVINNWDVKDENNSVYAPKHSAGAERLYVVSDLGASFGTSGIALTHEKSKGNLESYSKSKFIEKVRADSVDFAVPNKPTPFAMANPKEYTSRLHLRWIGKNIPREDARWMGQLLAKLSPAQIRDAFRAGGYGPDEIEGFAKIVEARIAELTQL
jgi:hypothetical protein